MSLPINLSRSTFLLLLLSLLSPLSGLAQTSVLDIGPTNLLLVYKCAPANRIALRDYMMHKGMADFDRWRSKGIFVSDKVLFSRYADTENWDMEIFLHFQTPEDVGKWNKIEKDQPSGLQAEALRLITAVSTYQMDMVETKSLATPSANSVYLTIPYEYTVSADEYMRYLHDYVVPQTSGWMDAGVLQSYKLFVVRAAAGRPWSAVFLLEYKDDAALGARDRVVKEVREVLKRNPGWKAISDTKHSVRVEKALILADELK